MYMIVTEDIQCTDASDLNIHLVSLLNLKKEELTETISKQKAHGPHHSPEKPVQINEYIWGKLWLYVYIYIISLGGKDFKIKLDH